MIDTADTTGPKAPAPASRRPGMDRRSLTRLTVITVLLLLDPDEAARRAGETDRLERAGSGFRERVDAAYRELAQRFPERIVALDGSRPADELSQVILERLRSRI